MKNLFLAFVATMFMTGVSFGQIVVIDPGNSTWLEVPSEIKSNEKSTSKLMTITKPVSETGGNVAITFDQNYKVVSIAVPKNPKIKGDALLNLYKSGGTPTSHCEDKPSDAGVLLCMVNTLIGQIISIFK